MRPPFAYYGGKTRMATRIVPLLPRHRHYVEPFAGSLAILLAKDPAPSETVNDLNGDLMTFWRVLRDRPDELIRACAMTPHSRAEHRASAERDDLDDMERARRTWSYLAQGRAGRLHHTGWRFRVGDGGSIPSYLAAYVRRMEDVAARIAPVSLECRPAVDVIGQYGAYSDALVYADPPYLGETRSGSGYQVDMRTADEHRELAESLRACRATVVLSGYDSPLYAELYDGWHATRLATSTEQGGQRLDRTEVLWSNRPLQRVGDLALPVGGGLGAFPGPVLPVEQVRVGGEKSGVPVVGVVDSDGPAATPSDGDDLVLCHEQSLAVMSRDTLEEEQDPEAVA